jgi:tRNA(Ile2) C34 agmatinyltransferase TiaS
MKTNQAEQRARLKAQAEVVIEEALAKGEGLKRLEDIEELVYETVRKLGQELEAGILRGHGQADGPGPVCEECGQEMRYKGDKTRYVVTRNGEQQLERGYYYCPACARGLFPPG